MNIIRTLLHDTPAGILLIGSLDSRVCLCDWISRPARCGFLAILCRRLSARIENAPTDINRIAAAQIDEYFSGSRISFEIPLLTVGTPFRLRVWNELMRIPYGSVISYARLAELSGNPRAVRAVAAACGANPISLLIPCHRVIGSNGALTGYAGGNEAKKLLLDHEGYCLSGR